VVITDMSEKRWNIVFPESLLNQKNTNNEEIIEE
jgi:hypothetical protein